MVIGNVKMEITCKKSKKFNNGKTVFKIRFSTFTKLKFIDIFEIDTFVCYKNDKSNFIPK